MTSAINRGQLAACRHWEQTGQRLPVLVLDLDRGEAWHCRPSGDAAHARLLYRVDRWPKATITEAECTRLNPLMRRYIASGCHALRDEGCAAALQEFNEHTGVAIDHLCESAASAAHLPFVSVLAIGRLSAYYPAEYRVRCMFSFAPLAPDGSLQFMGLVRAPSELLGRAVSLEVLMRQPDGSVAGRSLPVAQADTPLEQLTGGAIPGLPQLLGVPGGEVRFMVEGKASHLKLSGLGLPETGVLFAIGLSVREDGQLMCHLNSRALKSPVSGPVVPLA